MTSLITAAQQALEALESTQLFAAHEHYPRRRVADALDALRAALTEEALQRLTDANQEIEAVLEQPEQEPVALFTKYGPPTMRDRDFWSTGYATATARAIEAALKEKNT